MKLGDLCQGESPSEILAQEAAAAVLLEAQEGDKANEVSYATVIHARAKRGETELAEQWLSRMLEAGVEPNIVARAA